MKNKILFSILLGIFLINIVSAVTIPTIASYCDSTGGNCSLAGDGDFTTNLMITYAQYVDLFYDFSEGFGDGMNVTLIVKGDEDGLAKANITCYDANSSYYKQLGVITFYIAQTNITYEIPSECLNASNTFELYWEDLGTAESPTYWYDNYFTELILPSEEIVIEDKGELYNIMNSVGAGLGLLIEYLAISLPSLLIIFIIVAIIVIIGTAIGYVITNFLHKNK